MALTINHSLREEQIECHSASVGTTPAAAYVRVPFRGQLLKVGGVLGGTISAASSTVATAVNGTAVTGGSFALTVAGGAGFNANVVPGAATYVNEDDVISFTPSGATGTAIPGMFYAVVQAG